MRFQPARALVIGSAAILALIAGCAPGARPTATATAPPATATAAVNTTATSAPGGAEGTPTSRPAATPIVHEGISAPSVAMDPRVYLDLLGVTPDIPENSSLVRINDYAAMRELVGVSLEGADGQEKALIDYFQGLFDQSGRLVQQESPWISGMSTSDDFQVDIALKRREYLGFDARNVDQTLLLGAEPAYRDVLRGRFDPQASEQAIAGCEGCPQSETPEHLSIQYYRWGEDFNTDVSRQFQPPIFDRFGRGSSLAVLDGLVFRAVYEDGVMSLIAAYRDETPSLADREEFRLLTEAMARLGAYSMLLSDVTMPADPEGDVSLGGGQVSRPNEGIEEMREVIAQGPLLRQYQAVGVGAGRDARGDYLALALVHADAEAATANVALLRERIAQTESLHPQGRRPWADVIQEMEIATDGRVLLAKLYGAENYAGGWMATSLITYDPLLAHE